MNSKDNEEARTETISIKVTPTVKAALDSLPSTLKHQLILKILEIIDFCIYVSLYKKRRSHTEYQADVSMSTFSMDT